MQVKKKIMLFVAFLLVFTLSNALAYGLVIDAQNTTTCGLLYCETVLNMSKYLSPAQITAVKSLDLTNFLPKKNLNLTGINWKFNGNNIIIYGGIKAGSSNYWKMNLSTYLTIDPWWNASYTRKKQINVYTSNGATSQNFTVNINITYDSDMLANFSDTVFVNSTETGVLGADLQNYIDGSWGNFRVMFPSNITTANTTTYMYYGGAVNPNLLINQSCIYGDDFNRNDGSVGGGWLTTGAGTFQIVSNTMEVASTSWSIIYHNFTPKAPGLIYELDMRAASTTPTYNIRIASHTKCFDVGTGISVAYESALGKSMSGAETTTIIDPLTTNWYHIYMDVYDSTHANTTINSTKWADRLGTAQADFSNISFYAYNGDGFIDNVCIRNRFSAGVINVGFLGEETPPNPTSVLLTINGGVGAITHQYSGVAYSDNITAIVNVTSLSVNITINTTNIKNGTTSATVQYGFPVGVWNVTGSTPGSETYQPSNTMIIANITKATPNFTITFDPGNVVEHDTLVLVSCTNIPAQLLFTSGFYNDTSITDASYFFDTGDVTGVTYNLTCNTTGNANYTAFSTTSYLTVLPESGFPATIVTVCFTLESLNNCFGINTTNLNTFTTRSSKYCSSNTTLTQNISITNLGNISSTYASIDCPYGCDNITTSCNPPEYEQNLLVLGVILFVCFIMYIIFKKRK